MNGSPTEEATALKQQGADNNEIIEQLKNKGYSYEQISDALTQAEMKANIEGVPPTPSSGGERGGMQPSMMNASTPQQPPAFQEPAKPSPPEFSQRISTPQFLGSNNLDRDNDERIEEIAESIIDEKWQKLVEDIGDINVWKEKVKTNITSIKQEVVRIESRFESLQKAIVGKVNEYDKNIGNVGVEIKALEKLLQKIIEPLTRNVSELSRITERLKK